MKRQAFQRGEIRDENDNIISEGAYGKKTAFANKTNDGILDYIINNFQALFDMISGACVYVDTLPTSGDSDKLYVVKLTGKTYRWDGKQFVLVSESVDGLSAYEIAKQNGFEGTEQEWIKSIVSDTIESAETDASGTLIFTMKSGGKIKTTLRPIVECIKYMNSSQKWAIASDSPDDESDAESETGKTLSSKSWALASKTYASQSKQSETNAANSESNALQYKNAANDSKTAAATSASSASQSEANAKFSANVASTSATAANTSASSAKLSETHASTSETNTKQALAEAQKIQKQVESDLATLTSTVKYKGTVNSFDELPTKNTVGDMYNIKNAGGTDSNGTPIKAGDNVVWNGSGWDDQSGVVDLSDYAKNSEVSKTVVSTTYLNDTVTFIHKDGTRTTAVVNNVEHAVKASQDDKGQPIDIADIKSLITKAVNDGIAAAKLDAHPVGSYYWSDDPTDPGKLFGGKWEALPAGYTLIAQGSGTDEFGDFTYTAGQKYGERLHKLTVDELATHSHKIYSGYNNNMNSYAGSDDAYRYQNWGECSRDWHGNNLGTSTSGNSQAHNNVQPCVAAYGWRRIS